jgi:hypothetical protein
MTLLYIDIVEIQASEVQLDGSSRDSGPVITKWEQLSLAADLLRSLTKFG